ncbi:hypothetical protein [Paenibacillus piri]|uniref:Uncharacterized protein n=1 Tax=Paenibacillus piri TaxID=2547395 RepID=A0A4R5KIX3_9BACL|nr:hypothetical protein [Paenibacillus piri]TDF94725.1 hypothetical protein E1757_22470 [Paenibacillus piri]
MASMAKVTIRDQSMNAPVGNDSAITMWTIPSRRNTRPNTAVAELNFRRAEGLSKRAGSPPVLSERISMSARGFLIVTEARATMPMIKLNRQRPSS